MRRQKGCSHSALPTPEVKTPHHASAPAEPAGGGLTMDMRTGGSEELCVEVSFDYLSDPLIIRSN